MFFKRMTSTGAASTASADSDTAVPSSSAAGHARSGEIRARHGAGFVAPFNNNDGEDGDGGRRAGGAGAGGSSSSSSSSLNDADAAASEQQHQQQQRSPSSAAAHSLLTALVCLSWMAVSSALILLNKHLLASGFHYPMALSCLGMLFSSAAAFFCCRVTNIVEARRNAFSAREYLTRVMPVGLLMALTLHFGNVVYLYLTVSFIQMLKAFTPVVTMAALFAAGLEKPRRDLIGAVAAIAGGTALASAGEVNLSLIGVACMAASEAFEAARLVLTQTLLAAGGPRSLGPIEGLLYLAPACSAWLLAGSAVLELPAMRREGAWEVVAARPFLFLSAAAMGFACNALAYGVIRRAGSLTLKVLGTVKNVAVVGAGMALFGDRVAALQAVGYAVSIAGFVSYQRVKAGGAGGGSGGAPSSSSSSSSSASASASEKESAANGGSNGSGSGSGLLINSKIEAASSFIPAAKAAASAALPILASSSAGGGNGDVASAAGTDGEKRPLLPASFSAAAVPFSAPTSAAKDPAAAAAAGAAPLSTVDAIAAKLSGFFSFGATAPATATTNSEIAAGRV